MSLTRRNLLRAAPAFALAPIAFSSATPSAAKAPLAPQQAVGVLRRSVGSAEVIALLDGYMEMPPELFNAPIDKARDLSERQFEKGPSLSPVNAFVVNFGDRLVLIDTGAADAFGPTLGKLPGALQAAGIGVDQIDAVVLTHLHPDHIAGAVNASGNAVFPNAELVLPEADYKYWHDDGSMSAAPDAFKPFFVKARQVAKAYAGRTTQIHGEAEIFGSLRAVPLPGHTPGHTGFLLSSDNDSLYIWGDTIHHATFQLAHPEWGPAFDVDPQLAAATRRRSLDTAVSDKLMVAGMHMPFPATGHVARDGEGYRFVPAEWPYRL